MISGEEGNLVIRTIGQAVTVGTRLPGSWFRGHDATYGNLTPAVYRPQPTGRGGYREYWAAERFRLRAGSIYPKVPPWDGHLSWLLLMQHFGARTRLLDWTESILVALYFAVQGSRSNAGEIWCVRPDALNNLSGKFLGSFDRPEVKYLAAEAFRNEDDKQKQEKHARDFGVHEIPRLPLAFFPPLEFPRMSAQQSRFTIHPYPAAENRIQNVLIGPRQIVRYEIPADRKEPLLHDLAALGVTAESLFQSLDGLAKTIEFEVYDDDRGDQYPEPPRFDHERA
jgi:hypothetical protein